LCSVGNLTLNILKTVHPTVLEYKTLELEASPICINGLVISLQMTKLAFSQNFFRRINRFFGRFSERFCGFWSGPIEKC